MNNNNLFSTVDLEVGEHDHDLEYGGDELEGHNGYDTDGCEARSDDDEDEMSSEMEKFLANSDEEESDVETENEDDLKTKEKEKKWIEEQQSLIVVGKRNRIKPENYYDYIRPFAAFYAEDEEEERETKKKKNSANRVGSSVEETLSNSMEGQCEMDTSETGTSTSDSETDSIEQDSDSSWEPDVEGEEEEDDDDEYYSDLDTDEEDDDDQYTPPPSVSSKPTKEFQYKL